MKKISVTKYAKSLYEATQGLSGKDLSSVLANFAGLLRKNHHLKKFDRILTEYTRYVKKQSGEVELEIVSARKINPDSLKRLKKIFGNKVEVKTEEIDESLLGGVIIRTDDKIFDASVKTQLARLKQNLI